MFTSIVHSSSGYTCSYTSPSSSCDGYSWELESHVGSSDRYLGRCLTLVERRIVIGGIGGGAGATGCRFRMKRLFRTRTLPLFVLTKYFRFDPSSMMVSHILLVGCCKATWLPIWRHVGCTTKSNCLVFPGPVSQHQS